MLSATQLSSRLSALFYARAQETKRALRLSEAALYTRASSSSRVSAVSSLVFADRVEFTLLESSLAARSDAPVVPAASV